MQFRDAFKMTISILLAVTILQEKQVINLFDGTIQSPMVLIVSTVIAEDELPKLAP